MRRKSFADVTCSVAQAVEVVGDPWTLLIVRDALFGFRRFDDFRRRLDIPRNTLSDRLSHLVDHGILERVAYQSNPERFEYVLTGKGRDLRSVIAMLMRWGDQWSDLGAPPVVLIDQESGRTLEPVLVDQATGTPLAELSVLAVPGSGADDRTPLPPALDDEHEPNE